jgi:poly-beta-1,6-N-acetyl-D-glucosamine synthase
MSELTYTVVTPALNEASNLRRLASALVAQSQPPEAWIVVDSGSEDGSIEVVEEVAEDHAWVELLRVERQPTAVRGAPIVRSFLAGLARLDELELDADIVVKLDADVSMEPDFFARLLAAFAADPSLGIAGGTAYEHQKGRWCERHMTRTSVWGACRAYRRACLTSVLPLEERMGWDSIDEFRANMRGWRTATLFDVPFRHHRPEGQRDGSRYRAWKTQGLLAHYLGYRPSYLLVRVIYRSVRDPAALSMLVGYAAAAMGRKTRTPDVQARTYLRDQQALRRLPLRAREALGLRPRL